MERKVAFVWDRASDRVRRVLIAIAELQQAGQDTGADAVTRHLGGIEKAENMPALLAILRRSLIAVDSAPGEPPMLVQKQGARGRVAFQFAIEAVEAILRRKRTSSES